MGLRLGLLLAVLALAASACSDTASTTTLPPATSTTHVDTTTTTQPPPTTEPASPTTTRAPTTTTTSGLTAPIGSFRVTGVDADDVLNVRSGPGSENEIVGVLPSNTVGVRTTGAAATAGDGGLWWEVEQFSSPETGWVNSSFLAPQDGGPCGNLDGALALSHVFVETPRPGARVASGFLVRGCSRTFESTFGWRLIDSGGGVIAEGFAMGGGVDGPGSFAFTVEYEGVEGRLLGILEVVEDDASGGEGPPPVRNEIPVFLSADGAPEPVNPPDPCANTDGVLDDAFGIIVTAPFSGQRVSSGFALEGCSNTFEANVPWQLLDRDGAVIADSFAMGGGTEFAPFERTVDFAVDELQIGTLEVFEDDVSDGEGPPPVRNAIPVVLTP